MATKIVTKNSSTASAVPTASDLVQGELAVNVADKRLFTEDNGGSIVELGTNPSTIDINAGSIDGTAIGASSASTGAFTTLTATGIDVTGTATMDGLVVNTGSYGAVEAGSGRMYGSSSHGLVIQGSGTTNDFLFLGSDGSDSFRIGNNRDISFYEDTGTTPKFFWDASAESLGIGTTSPRKKLEVSGIAGANVLQSQDTADSTNFLRMYADVASGAAINVNTGGVIRFCHSAEDFTSFTEAMRIDASGNVGIGTANGDVTNDGNASRTYVGIIGTANRGRLNIGTTASNGADAGALAFTNGANTLADISVDTTAGVQNTGTMYVNGSRAIKIQAAASDEVVFNESGADVDFRVESDNNANALFVEGGNGEVMFGKNTISSNTVGVAIRGTSGETFCSISTGNTLHVYDTVASAFRFYVHLNGGISNYSANNVNLSDEREKKNVEALPSQWDCLKHWDLKQFHYNADDDALPKKYGVIAQEIEAHCPEVIDVFKVDEDTERMGVKEQQMMWMAIKALQEAQTRIESLEARIEALES